MGAVAFRQHERVLQVSRRKPGGGLQHAGHRPGHRPASRRTTPASASTGRERDDHVPDSGALAVVALAGRGRGGRAAAQPLDRRELAGAGRRPERRRRGDVDRHRQPRRPAGRAAVRDRASGDFGRGRDHLRSPATEHDSITGLRAAVGDGGQTAVVWSRPTVVPQTVVEVERARAGRDLRRTTAASISDSIAAAATEPAVAVGADGRCDRPVDERRQRQVSTRSTARGRRLELEQQASQTGATGEHAGRRRRAERPVVAAWVSERRHRSAARPPAAARSPASRRSRVLA